MGLDRPAGRSRPAHQERSARRREDVLAAVARLLARGGSVSTITIDEICAEADVSRSSLYLRWSSKDALWADVASAYLDDAAATVERTRDELAEVTDLDEFVEAVGVAYATWMFDRRWEAVAFAELAGSDPAVAATMARFTHMMLTAIATEVAERLPGGAPLPRRAQDEMARLVEVLLAAVRRAVDASVPSEALGSMPRDEFVRWFGTMCREMSSMLEAAVDDGRTP